MAEDFGSRMTSRAALYMALTESREDEAAMKQNYRDNGIRTAAVDFGGEFVASIAKMIERAVVCARREGLIDESHLEEGAVAGAAHEALRQLMEKAFGLNVGGKIGLARMGEHVSVAVFCGIGVLNLNEVGVGFGHRAI